VKLPETLSRNRRRFAPEVYKHALDPLETLTFAAARTRKIALRTSVLIFHTTPRHAGTPPEQRLIFFQGSYSRGLGLVGTRTRWMPQVRTSRSAARWQMSSCRCSRHLDYQPGEVSRQVLPKYPSLTLVPNLCRSQHPPIYMGAFVPRAAKTPGQVRRRVESSGLFR